MSNLHAGRITFKIDGTKHTTTGDCELDPSMVEADDVKNSDGTSGKIIKPKTAKITGLTFRRSKILNTKLLNDIVASDSPIDVTWEDIDTKLIYYYNDAWLTGAAKLGSGEGEISGIEVSSNNIREVQG